MSTTIATIGHNSGKRTSKAPKANATNAKRTELLANVSSAAATISGAFDAAVAAVKAAGGKLLDKSAPKARKLAHAEVRRAFMLGYMGARLPAGQDAAKVLDGLGFGSEGKAGKDQIRRTKEQERLYAAARKMFQRVLESADVETAEARGGKRNPKPGTTGKPKVTVTPPSETTPKVKTRAEAMTYVHQQAATLLAYAQKNAGYVPAELGTAIKAFHKAVLAYERGD